MLSRRKCDGGAADKLCMRINVGPTLQDAPTTFEAAHCCLLHVRVPTSTYLMQYHRSLISFILVLMQEWLKKTILFDIF